MNLKIYIMSSFTLFFHLYIENIFELEEKEEF